MDRQYIGQKLKELRTKKGVTQEEIAKEIGVSPSAYAQYETGQKVPRDDNKIAISKFLGESVQTIFFDENAHLK